MHCSVSCCTFCKLWRNFGVSVPSIISTDFLFQSLWFVSGFKALLLVIVWPVSGYNQLVCFKGFSDLSYSCHLQLKQCLPPFLDKNSTHHHDFLRHSQVCLCRPSWASAFKHNLWFALTLPPLKWLTEQDNPKSLQSLQSAQHDTLNLAVKWNWNFQVWLPFLIAIYFYKPT